MITDMSTGQAVQRCALCRALIRQADAKISPRTGHWLCADAITCARNLGIIVSPAVEADYRGRHRA